MTRRSRKEYEGLKAHIYDIYTVKGFREGMTFSEFKKQYSFKDWNDKKLTNFLKKLKNDRILYQPKYRGPYYLMDEFKAIAFKTILDRAIRQFPYDKIFIDEVDELGIIALYGIDQKDLRIIHKQKLYDITKNFFRILRDLQFLQGEIIQHEIEKKTSVFLKKNPDIEEKYVRDIIEDNLSEKTPSAVFFVNLRHYFNNEFTKEKIKPFFEGFYKKEKIKPKILDKLMKFCLDVIKIYLDHLPHSTGITLFAPFPDAYHAMNVIDPLHSSDYQLQLSAKLLEYGKGKRYTEFLNKSEELQRDLLGLYKDSGDEKMASICENNLKIIEKQRKKVS